MGLTVLYWNFKSQRADRVSVVSRVVRRHKVDLLVLADTLVDLTELLDELRLVDGRFALWEDPWTTLKVFTRFPSTDLEHYGTAGQTTVWRLRRGGLDVLLAAAHFYSRRTAGREVQDVLVEETRRTIIDAEQRANHRRTILFGDMNMEPFDKGIINHRTGLGALPTRGLTRKRSEDPSNNLRWFYNPAWSRMGREPSEYGPHTYEDGPPGTYYYRSSLDPFNLYWCHYDQLLVRPELFDFFDDRSFRILATIPAADGGPDEELIRCDGYHWTMLGCDHLPILFELHAPNHEVQNA
jgi:hypothetical protein